MKCLILSKLLLSHKTNNISSANEIHRLHNRYTNSMHISRSNRHCALHSRTYIPVPHQRVSILDSRHIYSSNYTFDAMEVVAYYNTEEGNLALG
mmetsp:Transcript_13782/g.17322  ORF Transcript_13782/g.17322 Transcript_13782/m.17322 type:complete len:94 (+) Transcript_13782:278-559(+)